MVHWQAEADGWHCLFESKQSGACHFIIVRIRQSRDFCSHVMMPNQITAHNAGIASQLAIERHLPGVCEFLR
jgi:hypothetical protein